MFQDGPRDSITSTSEAHKSKGPGVDRPGVRCKACASTSVPNTAAEACPALGTDVDRLRHIRDPRGTENMPEKTAAPGFPPNNFRHFLTLFSKFFASFPHGTCSLSVSRQYLALDGIYHPLRAAFPNNSTLRRHFTKNRTPRHTGFSPSMTSCSKEHRQGTAPKLPSPNYNSGTEGTRFQI